jgi:Na+/melibiose symporter-like transporter
MHRTGAIYPVYTVFTVPYMAMPTEMTGDYHERNLMSWPVFLTLAT